ncbi:MAG: DUF1552 domain-containing protein [Steroidobacteraceae bacterium]
MLIPRPPLHRRTLLRGLGTTLSLPLLEAMLPAARAADIAARPKRLLALYSPNGMVMQNFTPAQAGPGFTLSPTLQPFAPFQQRLTVVSNLAHNGGGGSHARGCAGFLTGAVARPTEGSDLQCGISVDQIIANRFASETPLPSLELGIDPPSLLGSCSPGYSCTYTNTLSWRSSTAALPVTVNPRDAFERLFGDGDALDAGSRLAEQRRRTSILDFVREDAARLANRLGSHDRAKMDGYLESVRDIEARIQRAGQHDVGAFAGSLARPAGIPESFAEHVRMMADLQVLAMQADITRVGSFMIGRELSNRTYPEVGVSDAHHMLSHHAGNADKLARISAINRLHMQHFAYFLERLETTRDGAGSLLDSTLVMMGTAFGDPNEHDLENLAFLLAGGGLPGNRHLVMPKKTSSSRALLAVVQRFGIELGTLGDSSQPISELAA